MNDTEPVNTALPMVVLEILVEERLEEPLMKNVVEVALVRVRLVMVEEGETKFEA